MRGIISQVCEDGVGVGVEVDSAASPGVDDFPTAPNDIISELSK